MYKLFSILIIIGFVVLASCSDDNSTNTKKTGMYYSSQMNIGNGKAKSFVNLDASGNPESVGVIFTEETLNGLDTVSKMFDLGMPSEAAATNVVNVSMDWNPKGHEPLFAYAKPHFDFHFYSVDMAFRMTMTGIGDDTLKMLKAPGADYLAENYVMSPAGVPMMGNHAVDTTSGEFKPAGFTETYIYGYYNGIMIFYEPMITRDYLLTKPTVNKTLKVPAKYPKTGYYPTTYNISFDDAKKEYTIKLGGMTKFSM